jgi:tetratricopeptide (TPR) repeat protein
MPLLENLSIVHADLGEGARAVDEAGRALTIGEYWTEVGAMELADAVLNYGGALLAASRFAEAAPVFERALGLYRAIAPGPPGEDEAGHAIALAIDGLGRAAEGRGRTAEALDRYREALALDERAMGTAHPEVAIRAATLGALLRDRGRCGEAVPLLERAIAIWDAASPAHVAVASPLTSLGACRLQAGDAAAAVAPLERALALRERHEDHPRETARTQRTLAAALWESGGDRVRAVALATAARSALSARPEAAADLADVDAWLAGHRGR